MENTKILQIIPAPAGMSAMHECEDGKACDLPIVALALVEEAGDRYVAALEAMESGEILIAQDMPDFVAMLCGGDHIQRETDA